MRQVLAGIIKQHRMVTSKYRGYQVLNGEEIIPKTVITNTIQWGYHILTQAVIVFLGMAFVILSACNPEDWQTVDCSECYLDEPVEAEINVRLTLRDETSHIVVNIYSGRIDEGILILSENVKSETFKTTLPVNAYYSVSVEYPSDYTTRSYQNIYAVDGGYVRTKKIYTTCDVPCWVIRGNNFDVRLKY
jgi:hypothetical protein